MNIHFNLLPPAQKKHLATQKVLRTIIENEMYIVAVMIVFVLALLAMYVIVYGDANTVTTQQQQAKQESAYQEVTDIRQTFVATHKDVTARAAMVKRHYQWARIIDVMNTTMADGVSVEDLSSQDNVVTIRATAQRREDVVALKDKFRAVQRNEKPCFTNLNVPEADLAAPTNLMFTMTFTIDPVCLH